MKPNFVTENALSLLNRQSVAGRSDATRRNDEQGSRTKRVVGEMKVGVGPIRPKRRFSKPPTSLSVGGIAR